MQRPQGFTLVELIIVIALVGVVGVMVSTLVSNQMTGYLHTQQRAELVQMAQNALQKITQDIHNAVPNSVRVNGDFLEMVPVVKAAPYRSEEDASGTSDKLDFSTQDATFDVLTDLVSATEAYNTGQIVVYNLGLTNGGHPVLGANLYADNSTLSAHVISGPGVSISNRGASDRIQLNVGHRFSQKSPNQKLFLVDGALSYGCNVASGTLTRYAGYPIQLAQPVNASATPLVGTRQSLLANQVSDCQFRYSAGSLARNAVVSLKLTLTQGEQSVTLMHQVQITNVP